MPPFIFSVDLTILANNNLSMVKKAPESRIQVLELQLEEALQMLKLVAQNKRTCLEVQEWLEQNHPENQGNMETLRDLMKIQTSAKK